MQGNNLRYYQKIFLFLAILIIPLASSEGKQNSAPQERKITFIF